jgi:hypothetical protein
MPDPAARLRALLDRTRNRDGGWPYYAGRQSRLEATSWVLLALGQEVDASPLERWRSADGLLVEPGIGSVNFAFNAVAALGLAGGASRETLARGVIRALVTHKGVAGPNNGTVIRQDATLQGWSWTDGTFSWVEPTAWCTLATKKVAPEDLAARARIDEAERLLRDRSCSGGGWNVGAAEIYGQQLPAHVPPTAVGVLAMQDRPDDPVVRAALDFLRREAHLEGSTTALALTWIALTSCGVSDDGLVAKLRDRVTAAEELGNVAVAALILYVLELHERGGQPAALMLPGGSSSK